MVGLLSGAGGAQEASVEADADEPQPNVSPEEQAQYDRFMERAFAVAYDAKAFPTIMERLADDPVGGLAVSAVMVVQRVRSAAEQAGVSLSPDVLYHGGADLMADLADTAGKAGVHQFTPDEVEAALYQALDMHRDAEEEAGTLDRGAFAEDMQKLVVANETGEIDSAFPDLARHFAGKGPSQGGAPTAPQQAPMAPTNGGL